MKRYRSFNFICGGCFLGFTVLLVLWGLIHTPYDPTAVDATLRNAAPSLSHPFGTDQLGRDVLSRVMVGARTSFFIGAATILLGGIVGTALDLDGRTKRLIAKRGGEGLANGLISASLLFCVGTFSIVGPIMSATTGDNTFLYTNATLDLVTSMVFATTYGIGIIFAAPILFCWQGMFYLIGKFAASTPLLEGTMINEMAIVGGLLIISSGLSLLKIKDCKTLNYIPALLVPALWFLIKGLF